MRFIRDLCLEDRLALAIGGAVCLTMVVALLAVGFNPLLPGYHLGNLLTYSAAWTFVVGGMILFRLAKDRPPSPFDHIANRVFDKERRADVRRAVLYSVLLAVFGTLFSLSKRSIPLFNDYGWDATFIAWDRALHGGRDAWLLLQPLLGHPRITWLIGGLYHLWVLLIYLGNFFFIFFERDARLRARYVIAYIACWTLIGFVAAAVFASVGPCFVGPILGSHEFDAQMAYLREVDAVHHLQVLDVQARLLEWYRDSEATLGAGIAAMPSMHVSQAFLFFLAMRTKPRWIAAIFGVFCGLILLGSVHLGYHYAVDGYVSLLMTGALWVACGRLVPRSARPSSPPAAAVAEPA